MYANLRLLCTDDPATNYEKLGTMYQTAHQIDGFNALRLYYSKLNPACNASFQLGPEESVWFSVA